MATPPLERVADGPEGVDQLAHAVAHGHTVFEFEADGGLIGFGRNHESLVFLSMLCGWTNHVEKNGGAIRLVSAIDGAQQIILPQTGSLNIKVYRTHANKIVKYRTAEPPTSDRTGRRELPPMGAGVEQIIDMAKLDHDHARVLRQAVGNAGPVIDPQGGAEREPSRPEDPTPRQRHRKHRVVREEPWSAHGRTTRDGLSKTYPSDAVMERTYNDGTTDWACRWEGCDYTDEENPRSVAAHYTSHRRGEGSAPQPEEDGIDPGFEGGRGRRIRRLASEVEGAWSALGTDATAIELAQWIIDHRVGSLGGGGDDESDTELSPDQVLDKIAALVDRGRGKILREQIDALQQQVDSHESLAESLEIAQRAAIEAAEQARMSAAIAVAWREKADKWDAVKDLIQDD